MAEFAVIGKPVPRVDAVDKVTGAARYAADVNLPGQLWAGFVHSPHPHARIKRIDTSKAECIPGVVKILTQDALGAGATQETIDTVHGMRLSQSLFAVEVVRYQGEKIAAVCAISPEICKDAVEAIEVEYERLPAVDEVEQAIRPEAPVIREDAKEVEAPTGCPWANLGMFRNVCQEAHFSAGDVEAGFAEADVIVEGIYRIPRVHQTYIEPHACVARVDPSGKVTVWTSTQSIFAIRSGVASSLGIPQSNINVVGQTIGGGFGGKFGVLVHPYAVLLAQVTGRPVKIVYSREEEMLDGRPAPGAVIWVKTGIKRDGTVTARQAVGLWDCGHVPGASIYATGRIVGVYNFKNIKYDAYGIYTNKPGTSAYRAPGAPQGSYASEANLNQCAAAIGMDPIALRLQNMAQDGDQRVIDRKPLSRVAFKETLLAAAKQAGWFEREKKPNHGWGVAIGEWHHGAGPGSAVVTLMDDGTLKVFSGAMDITGTDTGMGQIAAEVVGVPWENVRVIRGDTDSAPYATGSGGSVVLFSMGNAVKRAAENLREKMLALAAQHLETTVDSLEAVRAADESGRVIPRVQRRGQPEESVTLQELAQIALRTTGGPLVGTGTFASEPSHPLISAQIVEVEVDPETGVMEIKRLVGALDVGRAINPYEVEGQMQGGATQGLSWGWMEEMQFGQGRMLNTHLSDYRIPTIQDLPAIESVYLEVPSEHGPFGVKGIGEPPIVPTPAALHLAIHDATGAWVNDLPATPERIWRALHRNRDEGKG
ncbi:MAG: xanthine dehydrogenase family protein molybdopterin-binding subunit [Armatimonadetes bacterium]|nr:xanthine dehydrogenase family protein molybdopterin-binding subunit [Armatimonadota bacterium]